VYGKAKATAKKGPDFNQAVFKYRNKKYVDAYKDFKALCIQHRGNALCRYYLGLCAQELGLINEARAHYSWVRENGNRALNMQASDAAHRISKMPGYHRIIPQSSDALLFTPLPKWVTAGGKPEEPKEETTGAVGGPVVEASAKVKTIIDFYAPWCRWSADFEPTWNTVKYRYKAIEFKRLNAEDAANSELVQKFHVHAYPALGYMDAGGKVLQNQSGALIGDKFAKEIDRLNASTN